MENRLALKQAALKAAMGVRTDAGFITYARNLMGVNVEKEEDIDRAFRILKLEYEPQE